LRSPSRGRIDFALILHATLEAPPEQWSDERARALSLLREPGYQTVLGGRPLVFTFVNSDLGLERFHEFVLEARRQGLDPYSVHMGFHPASDYPRVADKGFDAASAYAAGSQRSEFARLAEKVERLYWRQPARAGVSLIPLVTTGWDKRPRQDNPVSWEMDSDYHSQKTFPSMATPGEIKDHLRNAIAFVEAHPTICEARAIVIYAWNEYDEGGWIAPTRGSDGNPDTTRLDAIREVLVP
jgi:hypothetical protein